MVSRESQVAVLNSAVDGMRNFHYSDCLPICVGKNFMMSLFRLIGRFEGLSFLLLLFIAMPLKYLWGMPEAVRVVGMAHGGLFLAYVAMANYVALELRWSKKLWFLSMVAAVLPFGTFIFEKKHLASNQSF
jgi:integral membrane protein